MCSNMVQCKLIITGMYVPMFSLGLNLTNSFAILLASPSVCHFDGARAIFFLRLSTAGDNHCINNQGLIQKLKEQINCSLLAQATAQPMDALLVSWQLVNKRIEREGELLCTVHIMDSRMLVL